jgi:hypothetical protein
MGIQPAFDLMTLAAGDARDIARVSSTGKAGARRALRVAPAGVSD